jgi:hypothetical protein
MYIFYFNLDENIITLSDLSVIELQSNRIHFLYKG